MIEPDIQKFKAMLKRIFDAYCKMGPYTQKFYQPDLVSEQLDHLEYLELLSDTISKRCNVYIKQAYRSPHHAAHSLLWRIYQLWTGIRAAGDRSYTNYE